jgi:hypothetical protein
VAEDLGKLLAATRRLQLGGRIVLEHLLPPEMPVEGAQAGGLAMDGRRRARRAAIPLGEIGEEI